MTERHIQAIETSWNGYSFRSRLEARWAIFLHALAIPYEYEAQGFDLGTLGKYLPDFSLLQRDTWIEVKPTEPSDLERERAKRIACDRDDYMDIVVGVPDASGNRWGQGKGQVLHCYPGSTPPGIQKWHPLVRCVDHWLDEQYLNLPFWQQAIEYAVEQARSARFEHGEVPRVYNAWQRASYEYHGTFWADEESTESKGEARIVEAWALEDSETDEPEGGLD